MARKKSPIPTGMTRRQRTIYKFLLKNKGSFLIPHRKMTGTFCYRLMTKDYSPVENIRKSVISEMLSMEFLIKIDNKIILKNEEA